jgi:branched-chain amino acid transport system substrate-binding protein
MVPKDYEVWIMQTDGMIIYDLDKEEIGKILFSDPIYKDYGSLLKLGKKIAAAPEGEGSYIFLSPGLKEKVIKDVIWKTVKLHDREWRVVLAYRPYE